jgi:conjugative transfer region protein (TIGR03748 family)
LSRNPINHSKGHDALLEFIMSKFLHITSLSLLALATQAANVTQINRYATVMNKPLAAQVNPLLAVQQIHFPQEVKTVGEAIEWWLHYSGFSLVSKDKQPESLQTVMQQTLPQIHRNIGPLTIKEGLETLAGYQIFMIVENPLLRQVNFKLKRAYQSAIKPSVRSKA